MPPQKIHLTHIITGLDTGGAEMMLFKLLTHTNQEHFHLQVISLTDCGAVGENIKNAGIPVETLGMRRGKVVLGDVLRLATLLKKKKPHIVQTWMYHADLIGGLAAKSIGVPRILWNIRNSTLDPKTSKLSTRIVVRICAFLAYFIPQRIICCSEVAQDVHTKQGYPRRKMQTLPNGFNLDAFRPNKQAYQQLRKELGLPEDATIVGLVGRYDPQKDHKNFIASASSLAKERQNLYFVLCGEGIHWNNTELATTIEQHQSKHRFHLLGRRSDIPQITPAFDIAVSSSAYGEAFSNTLGEAMACGVPCVSTDVGEARFILGETGRVVPPQDSTALAEGIASLLDLSTEERSHLGTKARERIQQNFSIERVAEIYSQLYKEMCAECVG